MNFFSVCSFRERSFSDTTFPLKIVPLFRNFSLHGRKILLDGIHSAFNSEGRSPYHGPASVVLFERDGKDIYSPGEHVSYEYENDYNAIFWLRAGSGVE